MVEWKKKILPAAILWLILAVLLASYTQWALIVGAIVAGALAGWKAGGITKGAFNGAMSGVIGGIIGGAAFGFGILPQLPQGGSEIAAGILTPFVPVTVVTALSSVGGPITFAITATGLIFGAVGGALGAAGK